MPERLPGFTTNAKLQLWPLGRECCCDGPCSRSLRANDRSDAVTLPQKRARSDNDQIAFGEPLADLNVVLRGQSDRDAARFDPVIMDRLDDRTVGAE